VVVNFSPLSPAGDLAAQARDAGVGVMITSNLTPMLGHVLEALARQAVSNQKRPAVGRDFAGTSESHRLVEDTAAAEVTARRGGRKGFTERLGLRNAIVLSEVLGPPRSMQEM
jgi:hypothetical protein